MANNVNKINFSDLNDGFFKFKKLKESPWNGMDIPKPLEAFAKVANVTYSSTNKSNEAIIFIIYLFDKSPDKLFTEIRKLEKSSKGLDVIRAFFLQAVLKDRVKLSLSAALKDSARLALEKIHVVLYMNEAIEPIAPWLGVMTPFRENHEKGVNMIPRIHLNHVIAETFRDIFGV